MESGDSSDTRTPREREVDNETEYIIKNGVCTFARRDNYGRTRLMNWCKKGEVKIVDAYLSHGAREFNYLNAKDCKGRTALTIATYYNHEEIVNLLLQSGADLDISTVWGDTALIIACRNNHENIVKLLLENGAKISDSNQELMTVCCNGGESIVKTLLQNGASCNKLGTEGMTPLMQACRSGHECIVKILLDHGSEVNCGDQKRTTAVMHAAERDKVKCLAILCAEHADLDQKDNTEKTVLSYALRSGGDYKCLRHLLGTGKLMNGRNLKQVHKYAMTSAMLFSETIGIAMEYGLFQWEWVDFTDFDHFKKIVVAAIQSGMCPNSSENGRLQSPLIRSILENDTSAVETIFKHRYFFPEDYMTLSTDPQVTSSFCSRTLLEKITLQPLSLLTWSFLVVSKAISLSGPPAQRPERVDKLPLPTLLKKSLKFQIVKEDDT